MALAQHKRAVGVFSNRRDAEHAFNELKSSGFSMDRVSVIARDADREGEIAGVDVRDRAGNKADEGAAAGAITGGTLGGITGLLVGAGALAIPGVGPILLAGELATTLATTLAGGAIGAAAGGLVGALVGLGIPEERAKIYNDRVSRGDYLVLVQGTDAEIARAQAVLHSRGIEEWGVYDAPDATPASSSYAAMPGGGIDGATMPVSAATGMPLDYAETATPVDRSRPNNAVTPSLGNRATPLDRSRTTESDRVTRQRIPTDPGAEIAPQRRAIGVFANRREAENALTELSISGFPMDKVSVLAKNPDDQDSITNGGTQSSSDRIGDKADEGAVAGAAAGGALGGMTGLLVGLGALAVPGIGPVMAAGAMGTTLATALSGGAIGAAAGGLVGALVGLGIPEERAKVYNERLSRGEYLLFLDGSREQVQTAEATLSSRGIQEWGTFDAVELKPRVTIIDRRDETRR